MKAQIIVLLAIFVSFNAQAEKTLQECIDTTNPQERLNCYDTVFNRGVTFDDTATASSTNKPLANSNVGDNFGKETIKVKPSEQDDERSATAVGTYGSLEKGDIISLDNGQKWKVIDTRSLNVRRENPRVLISRGMFRSYFISFEGFNRKLKVARMK